MKRTSKPHRREHIERYAKLRFSVLNSDAYLGLRPSTRALLIQFAARIWPENNGKVFISVRDAAAMMGALDHHTAANSLHELAAHGFICEVSKGSFKRKASINGDCRASIWRATWIPIAGKSAATNDFQNWRAQAGSQAAKRVVAGRDLLLRWRISPATAHDFDTVHETDKAFNDQTRGDFTTRIKDCPDFSTEGCSEESHTHEVSMPHALFLRSAVASPSQCEKARVQATNWLSNTGTRQGELARMAGLSPSKLSRFLSRPAATLTREQLLNLRSAMAPDYQVHEPRSASIFHIRKDVS